MNLGYYPGCALHGSSNDSTRACAPPLGRAWGRDSYLKSTIGSSAARRTRIR